MELPEGVSSVTEPERLVADGDALGLPARHAAGLFLTVDLQGRILGANARLHRLLGHPEGTLPGRSVEAILGVGSRIFWQTHLFPLLRLQRAVEEIFLLLRAADGADVGVLLDGALRRVDDVEVADFAMLRVRERQRFEAELIRARKEAEEAAQRMEAQNRLLETQQMELELHQDQMHEQRLELEAQAEELHAMNDELVAVNARLQATNEELARERLAAQEANKAKGAFLATMSHELRTPINAILGYTDLLVLGMNGPLTEGQRGMLERVGHASRHLLRLVNDVLNLARIESGRLEYAISDVPVEEVVREVMPMAERLLADRELTHAVRLVPGLVARADREKLVQVLLNLLGNAAKFTPAGGHVEVEGAFAGDGRFVELRIRDDGIGIAREKLESIFEPFVQVDTGRTRRSEGTGLGLAISRDLARGMGGDLTVRSASGEGSEFTVVLRAAG